MQAIVSSLYFLSCLLHLRDLPFSYWKLVPFTCWLWSLWVNFFFVRNFRVQKKQMELDKPVPITMSINLQHGKFVIWIYKIHLSNSIIIIQSVSWFKAKHSFHLLQRYWQFRHLFHKYISWDRKVLRRSYWISLDFLYSWQNSGGWRGRSIKSIELAPYFKPIYDQVSDTLKLSYSSVKYKKTDMENIKVGRKNCLFVIF